MPGEMTWVLHIEHGKGERDKGLEKSILSHEPFDRKNNEVHPVIHPRALPGRHSGGCYPIRKRGCRVYRLGCDAWLPLSRMSVNLRCLIRKNKSFQVLGPVGRTTIFWVWRLADGCYNCVRLMYRVICKTRLALWRVCGHLPALGICKHSSSPVHLIWTEK